MAILVSRVAYVAMCLDQFADGEPARDNAVLIGVPYYEDIQTFIDAVYIYK